VYVLVKVCLEFPETFVQYFDFSFAVEIHIDPHNRSTLSSLHESVAVTKVTCALVSQRGGPTMSSVKRAAAGRLPTETLRRNREWS
jgi:hypothetical protein